MSIETDLARTVAALERIAGALEKLIVTGYQPAEQSAQATDLTGTRRMSAEQRATRDLQAMWRVYRYGFRSWRHFRSELSATSGNVTTVEVCKALSMGRSRLYNALGNTRLVHWETGEPTTASS
jgi:hypothetical protein